MPKAIFKWGKKLRTLAFPLTVTLSFDFKFFPLILNLSNLWMSFLNRNNKGKKGAGTGPLRPLLPSAGQFCHGCSGSLCCTQNFPYISALGFLVARTWLDWALLGLHPWLQPPFHLRYVLLKFGFIWEQPARSPWWLQMSPFASPRDHFCFFISAPR